MKCQKVYKNSGTILVEILISLFIVTSFIMIGSSTVNMSITRFEYIKAKKILLDRFNTEISNLVPLEENTRYEKTIFDNTLKTNINIVYSWRKYLNIGKEIDFWLSASTSQYSRIDLFFARIVNSEDISVDTKHVYDSCSIDMTRNEKIGDYAFWQNQNPYISRPKDKLDIRDYKIKTSIKNLNVHNNLYPTSMYISSSTLYISEDSNVISDPDLYIFDINGTNLNVLKSINTGPGIAEFQVDRDHIYVANRSTTQQLQILDISNGNLSIIAKYRLPLLSTTTEPTLGSTITKFRDYVFLGTEKWDGNEINIFDVHDISNTILISGIEIGSKVSDMSIVQNSLYVVSSQNHQFQEYDIANIFNPRLIREYYYDGSERQDGKILSLFENSIFIGRTNGGFNINYQYELYYYRDYINRDFSQIYRDIPGGVYGILSDRQRIYMITKKSGNEFEIFDKELSTTTMKIDLPISPRKMICFKNNFYILGEQSPFVYELNIERNE